MYTEDYRKHCGGITNCPRCGLADSRLHRLEECQYTERLCMQFPGLMRSWRSPPEHVKCFNIFPTPGSLRTWQSCLDRIPWPSLPRSTSVEKVLIYTDGGCFFPRYSHLRLAFYASIIPGTSGDLGPRLASRFMPYGLSGGNHGGALGGTFIFETCCHS